MECDYQLSWLPYEKSVINLYRNSLPARALKDITLFCEGKEIHAHKLVLSVMSLYFQDVILSNPSTTQIILYNVKYDDLKCVIDYMYSGELYVLHDRFQDVKELVVCLKVRGFVDTDLEVNSASQDFVPQNSQHLNSIHQPENEPEFSEPQSQESMSLLPPFQHIAPFQQKMQQVQDLKQKKEPESTTTAEQQSCSSVTAAETTSKPQTQSSKAKVVDKDNTTSVSSSTNSLKEYGASENSQQSSNIVEESRKRIILSTSESSESESNISMHLDDSSELDLDLE